MTLSTAFSSKGPAALLLAGLLFVWGCARPSVSPQGGVRAPDGAPRVAVLPVENLSGTAAPLKDVQRSLIQGLTDRGLVVLDDETLRTFMARHRVRYIGGLDRETSQALEEETGADSALITSVELYNAQVPPRVALTVRLISTDVDQKILWMDGKSFTGFDRPGLLGLGLVNDPKQLLDMTVHQLLDSLTDHLSLSGEKTRKVPARYDPRVSYRSEVFDPDTVYRVAVVPFTVLGGKRNAGDIMGLHFLRSLSRFNNFTVVEPGMVREVLLRHRIIMPQGPSLADTDVLFGSLAANLILTGTVFQYEDTMGANGTPSVEFSVQLIERESREVVWSSRSSNEGNDGVYFFDFGRVNTAQTLAMRMVQRTVERLVDMDYPAYPSASSSGRPWSGHFPLAFSQSMR